MSLDVALAFARALTSPAATAWTLAFERGAAVAFVLWARLADRAVAAAARDAVAVLVFTAFAV
ncbi:hypothetical protein [Methyloferula stellata]|uniref:hypothetical protein n=1 Tax=Methyloferula stellata TaxID=876270 RepID=UPI001FCB9E82|nr:hypothetical protein [Methyloferula stellata]